MALRMPHPTSHPKTGIFRARIAVPKHLRTIIQRDHGAGTELHENLGTRDKAEAVRRSRPVFDRFDGWLRAAQAEFDGQHDRLTDHEVGVLVGRWLRQREAENRADMGLTEAEHEEAADFLGECLHPEEGSLRSLVTYLDEPMKKLLADSGRTVDDDSRSRLARRLGATAREWHRGEIVRASTGRAAPLVTSEEFPMDTLSGPQRGGTTMDTLLESWAADRGYDLDAKPIDRAAYDRKRTMERLSAFLSHRDASRVTKADAVRWKAEMLGRKAANATVRNDLSEMSAVWKHGVANGLVTDNPFHGISPPKDSKVAPARRPFTDEEARLILRAAWLETGALRWLPWVCALTGARVSEPCQSVKEDVARVQGVHTLRIHIEGEGRSLKNKDSVRTVPIHPALVAEGFLDYVAALPAGSPLFPDLQPDRVFGRRGTHGSRKVSQWLRNQLNLTDKRISPSHSWRHTFTDLCREVAMHPEVRSALTGHSAKLDESAAYGRGMGSFIKVLADALAKVRSPLDNAPEDTVSANVAA